jgi:hypothetical protein
MPAAPNAIIVCEMRSIYGVQLQSTTFTYKLEVLCCHISTFNKKGQKQFPGIILEVENKNLFFLKIFNYFFAFLFVLFAAVQWNDPDPLLWIAIYLYAAFLCLISIRKKPFNSIWFFAGIGFYIIYATFLFAGPTGVFAWMTVYHFENIVQSMEATKPWIEETREFFGLIILILVASYNLYAQKRIGLHPKPGFVPVNRIKEN